MDGPAEAGTPLGPHGHELPGGRCALAAPDTGVGKAEQEAAALEPGPDRALTPCLPHLMQAYVGSPG